MANKTSKKSSKRQIFGNWRKSNAGKEVIRDQLRHQLWMCASCFLPLQNDYHVHHMLPVSKIEEDEEVFLTDGRNLVILCPKCNLTQGAKTDTRFY